MKILIENDLQYFIRFDKNEEVLEELSKLINLKNIQSAYFTCIGSVKGLVLSYYNLTTKQYEDHTLDEDLEVVSITGNVAIMNDKPVIHAHGVFSKKDLHTVGGHIKKLLVSATCEVFLTNLSNNLSRSFDNETGLNLLQ